MKNGLKKILQKILFILAKSILNKYQPKVVGITGSIGKSSTKEAVLAVLNDNFRMRTSIKNYNNEIGLPLTIIGEKSAGRDIFGWLKIFYRALKLIVLDAKIYPEILILEMGVDRIGDMKYLVDLAPADIGIVTNVGPVHLEFFKTVVKIAKEKGTLVSKLKPGGWGILNGDNELVYNLKNNVAGRFLIYGLGQECQIRALEADLSYRDDKISGLSFKLSYNGAIVPVFLPNVLAEHLIYSALAAAAVGIILEMNLLQIAEALQNFVPPLGRMHLLASINGSQIIDDSYNASPESMIAAVKSLGEIKVSGRKIAVLGDMLELGDYETKGHEAVGLEIAKVKPEVLIVVGDRAKTIANTAINNGFKGEAKLFKNSLEAGEFLMGRVGRGDLILVKGSQGMRMEKIAKILLAEPSRASELLVRQEEEWLK